MILQQRIQLVDGNFVWYFATVSQRTAGRNWLILAGAKGGTLVRKTLVENE